MILVINNLQDDILVKILRALENIPNRIQQWP